MEYSGLDTIKEWTNFKEIQVFLGFAHFYCQFIIRCSRIVAVLTSMLRKGTKDKFKAKFVITNDVQELFYVLRQVFITVLMLCHFDFSFPIQIETDASDLSFWQSCLNHTSKQLISTL